MHVPSQKVEFLGFIVDSEEMIVSFLERKIIKLRDRSAFLSENLQCSI